MFFFLLLCSALSADLKKNAYFEIGDAFETPISPFLNIVNGFAGPSKRDFDNFTDVYRDYLHVRYMRTHDLVHEDYKHGCDMHVVYPDTTCDPTDQACYNFNKCDKLMSLFKYNDITPYLRIGVSWGSDYGDYLPPADVDNLAAAVVVLVQRYRSSFASDDAPLIVELWNEPFNPNAEFWPQDDASLAQFAPTLIAVIRALRDAGVAKKKKKRALPEADVESLKEYQFVNEFYASFAHVTKPVKIGCCGFAPGGCKDETGREKVANLKNALVSSGVWSELDFVSFHTYSNDPGVIDECVAVYSDNLGVALGDEMPFHLSEWNFAGTNTSQLVPEAASTFMRLVKANAELAAFFYFQANHEGDDGYGLFASATNARPTARVFWLIARLYSSAFPTRDAARRLTRLALTSLYDDECELELLAVTEDARSFASRSVAVLASNEKTSLACALSLKVPKLATRVTAVTSYAVNDSSMWWPVFGDTHAASKETDDAVYYVIDVNAREVRLIELELELGLLVYEADVTLALPDGVALPLDIDVAAAQKTRFRLARATASVLNVADAAAGGVRVDVTPVDATHVSVRVTAPAASVFSAKAAASDVLGARLMAALASGDSGSQINGVGGDIVDVKVRATLFESAPEWTQTTTAAATTTTISKKTTTLTTTTTPATTSTASDNDGGGEVGEDETVDADALADDDAAAASFDLAAAAIVVLGVGWLATLLICALCVVRARRAAFAARRHAQPAATEGRSSRRRTSYSVSNRGR